jgi:acyl-CoA thioester hydrolase
MTEPLDPARATSRHRIGVRFCETDLMGVVHHANYLLYCEEARVNWLHRRGVRYATWQRLGIQLPVVEARLRFKRAAHFDDTLDMVTTAVELTRVTVRFAYSVECDGAVLCQAETLLACVGNDLRLCRMPDEVAATFRSGEHG